MIGYGTGENISNSPPFWILNEELQEHEMQMKTNTSQFMLSATLL